MKTKNIWVATTYSVSRRFRNFVSGSFRFGEIRNLSVSQLFVTGIARWQESGKIPLRTQAQWSMSWGTTQRPERVEVCYQSRIDFWEMLLIDNKQDPANLLEMALKSVNICDWMRYERVTTPLVPKVEVLQKLHQHFPWTMLAGRRFSFWNGRSGHVLKVWWIPRRQFMHINRIHPLPTIPHIAEIVSTHGTKYPFTARNDPKESSHFLQLLWLFQPMSEKHLLGSSLTWIGMMQSYTNRKRY